MKNSFQEEKKMKLIVTFLMLFSVSNAFSQATTETTAPAPTTTAAASNSTTDLDFWERIKKAPVGFVITNEMVADTKTTSVTGITNATDAVFTYKLTSKNALKLASGFTVYDTNTTNTDTSYNGSALIFSRTGLLSQDKHGVNMYANIRYKALPGGSNVPGYASLRTGASRTFSPVISATTEVRWEEYVRGSSEGSLNRRKFAFIASPSITLTEKLGVSPTMVFSHSVKGANVKDTNYVNFAPSIDYTFDPKFSGSLYWDTYPLKSADNSFLAPRWYSQGSVGLYLSYAVL